MTTVNGKPPMPPFFPSPYDLPEIRTLLDNGWKHVGGDMWQHPRAREPIRRESALKIEAAFTRALADTAPEYDPWKELRK